MKTYQIKEMKHDTRAERMLPHYCNGLREFAEKVIEWHGAGMHYQLIDGCLYEDSDVDWAFGADDMIPVPTGDPIIDPDNPQDSYYLTWESYTYTAVEVEL